jgi:hypothetical protein
VVIDTAAIPSVMGVVFRPGGARGFFDGPASDFYRWIEPDPSHFKTRGDGGRTVHGQDDMAEPAVKGIPDGASVVTPRLFCRDVAREMTSRTWTRRWSVR